MPKQKFSENYLSNRKALSDIISVTWSDCNLEISVHYSENTFLTPNNDEYDWSSEIIIEYLHVEQEHIAHCKYIEM